MRSIKVNLDKKVLSSYEIRIGKDIIDRMVPIIAKVITRAICGDY